MYHVRQVPNLQGAGSAKYVERKRAMCVIHCADDMVGEHFQRRDEFRRFKIRPNFDFVTLSWQASKKRDESK